MNEEYKRWMKEGEDEGEYGERTHVAAGAYLCDKPTNPPALGHHPRTILWMVKTQRGRDSPRALNSSASKGA